MTKTNVSRTAESLPWMLPLPTWLENVSFHTGREKATGWGGEKKEFFRHFYISTSNVTHWGQNSKRRQMTEVKTGLI